MTFDNKGLMGSVLGTLGVAVIGVGIAAFLLWGCPQYNVYKMEMEGKARLAEAEQSRRIRIQEANAEKESAVLLAQADIERAKGSAQADIERAKGIAQANKIIGISLKENEAYLRYLYITNLGNTQNQVIYIPTESGMPILEAGRTVKMQESIPMQILEQLDWDEVLESMKNQQEGVTITARKTFQKSDKGGK